MKKPALLTVFFVVLMDLIGFGIVLPHLAYFAHDFGADPVVVGLLYSIYSMAQLVFSPLWGSLSDRIGRRPVMMISTVGSCVSYLILAFSSSLWMLFVSRLFAGIMAGNISAAQAYVSDVTTVENRAKGMGLIGAAFGLGFMIGPALGAVLSGMSTNPYLVIGLFAAFMSGLSFVSVCFFLPESLNSSSSKDDQRPIRFGIFSTGFWVAILSKKQGGELGKLFSCAFLLSFAQSSIYGAFPLFCKNELNLSSAQVGYSYTLMGIIAIFVQGGLLKFIVKKFGEKKVFLIGNIFLILGLSLVPFASDFLSLSVALAVMSIGGSLNIPTMTSLISQNAKKGEYGLTLGVSQGLSALGRAMGPLWGGVMYAISFRFPFVLTAMIASLTIIFSYKIQKYG